MRRFFSLIGIVTLLSSLVLLYTFRYSIVTVFYHLLIIAGIQLGMTLFLLVLFLLVKNRKAFTILLHITCFLDLFILVQLYLMILSSNYFWKKTITFSVIKNYTRKFGSFVDALPVQGWIFYAAIILICLLVVGLYYLCRPRVDVVYKKYSHLQNRGFVKHFAIGMGCLFIAMFLFRKPLMHFKRIMHFAEEPVLQFALGNLWGKGNEVAFDKERYLLGEKDKPCLDSLHVKPNTEDHPVIIILMDAMRSDHLSMYGYQRKTTPFLDSLYQSGKLFAVKNFFSPSTNTVGGVAGMFFSRDWENFGYTGLNLMKYLKQAGYTTYSFLTGYHRDWFGLSALYRGSCDYYFESPKDPDTPPDDDLVTIKKFMGAKLDKRSFIYIHLLSTHTIGRKDPLFKKYMPDKIGFGVDQKTALVNNYDNGVLQADYVISNIFKKLEQEHLLENSTVMILADHGELFGEGGQWSHGGSVQPKLITIPLLVYDQHPEWYVNKQAATLKDIAPTVVERLNYPLPACWDGISLHRPAHDFTLKINAVAECDYPFGLLTKKDSSYKLDVLDSKHKFVKTIPFTP